VAVILLLLVATVVCLGHQVAMPLLVPDATSTATAEPLPPTVPDAPSPSGSPSSNEMPSPTVLAASQSAPTTPAGGAPTVLTIAYDNRALDPGLRSGWGFACAIETPETTILFDTGAEGDALLYNLRALGIDPAQIEIVILSHNHADHTGGLEALLGLRDDLVIYAPESFAEDIVRRAGGRGQVVEVLQIQPIVGGVWTLGEMGTSIREQSVVVEGSRGLTLITGCAHPGIVSIAERALEVGPVDLVLGGFHLGQTPADQIETIIERLQGLGIARAAPGHCTGELAIEMFRAAYGDGYLAVYVGTRVELER
jgi:7,8-dihydropterin-6-yl-methyl-4-(beta-D-ribofuranosyl)aminobenzene 5'-phosphate synthase